MKKKRKIINKKLVEDFPIQSIWHEVSTPIEDLYYLSEDQNKLKTLQEMKDKDIKLVALLKKMIIQNKLTEMQSVVIGLRLGYVKHTFAKKYYIGPRTNAQIAIILGIAKCTVTKHLHEARKRIASLMKE